jgi:hypothetical protein
MDVKLEIFFDAIEDTWVWVWQVWDEPLAQWATATDFKFTPIAGDAPTLDEAFATARQAFHAVNA